MSTRQRPSAILITGPTASGKSAFALALGHSRGGVIINADSMQVYAQLRVLTARPTTADEALVPHRLYGHVSASEPYSVARWLNDVTVALAETRASGRLPIIIGGTGLYFKALLEGLSPLPQIPDEIRARWRQAGEMREPEDLHADLTRRDPLTAAQLRPSDTQRLVRALEVIEATGRPLAEWQQIKGKPVLEPEEVAKIVVARPRDQLYQRATQRFLQMVDEGALDEAHAMQRLHLDPSFPAMRALGLAPLTAFLKHELNRRDAIAIAIRNTRQYIKRQETWLKRYNISWNWFNSQEMQNQIDIGFPIVDFMD
jgi:tRNA dimethylallyltransferase